MAKNKVIYQNWIVEIGYDPSQKDLLDHQYSEISLEELIEKGCDLSSENNKNSNSQKELIIQAVKKAISKLTQEEQEFIYRFYFMGERYNSLADKSNKELYKLNSIHKQAIKKLKINLSQFVKEQFGVETEEMKKCQICQSNYVNEINNLIINRDKRKTWGVVIKKIESKYNMKIKTPQLLIGHEKYHI